MSRRISTRVLIAGLVLGLVGSLSLKSQAGGRATRSQDTIRIGLIGSLFRDQPSSAVSVMMEPFAALMQSQTGLTGDLVPGGDAFQLGQQLSEGKLHVAVFHGFEFAWARLRYPELRPLIIAVNRYPHLNAQLIVSAKDPANSLRELEGKRLALPRPSREHCHLFLERHCQECAKKTPQSFFAKVANPPNAEDALDDVVEGQVDATVVDGLALECYRRRKPGRFAKLKVVESSETFPAAVVAYCPGCLDDTTLNRFRTGLLGASKSMLGKQLLTLWKLTGFEPVPDDYEQTLAAIAKAYPPPAETK
jgi:ABC-type phosphate/phosphonate transport system substrate-binding protein